VEDHGVVRTAVRNWLSGELPDWTITEATSGDEGVSVAQEQCPHVILMDVGLPGISGIEATRRIKHAHPEIGILVWTLGSNGEKRRAAMDAGADAFLSKDTHPEEVVRVLKELMDQALQQLKVCASPTAPEG
jgi:DNA-binding NarL/FixJ family response regulator